MPMTFARAFLLFFPLIFILLTVLEVSPGRLVFNSLLFSLMLAWVTRVLTRTPRTCVDSDLFDLEQRRRVEKRRFRARMRRAEGLVKKNADEALGLVEEVLAENPVFAEALYLRAVIRARRNETGAALADLRLAMQNSLVDDPCFKKASRLHSELIGREI